MVATYGYDGIVWTPLIEASEIEGAVIDYRFTPEGLEPPIIDLPEGWILLQSDEVSLEAFSGVRSSYQVGNSSIEVLLLQGVIPHLAADGDLAVVGTRGSDGLVRVRAITPGTGARARRS